MRTVHVVLRRASREKIWITHLRCFAEKERKEKKAQSLLKVKQGYFKKRKDLTRHIGRGEGIIRV